MCFSASSSFTASVLLSGIGILALKNNRNKTLMMVASIPLLFGIQQFFEGIVWLTINNPNDWLHKFAAYIFLFFATALWPVWVPLALAQYDKGKIQKILYGISVIGFAIAGYVLYKLLNEPTYATQVKNSIFYYIGNVDPFVPHYGIIIYSIPTILPFFITKLPLAKIGGTAIAISLLVAYHIKNETFTSVWCFFSAVLSIFILFSLDKANQRKA